MRINLKKEFFGDREFTLVENDSMRAVAFCYSTGVEAIRVENSKGYFIILPFQGQQIWRANFLGKDLVMKTHFDEPVATTEYLKTYGGFFLHCGICACGVPQSDDNHPLHGETPNAVYDNAYIECNDEYIAVGGALEYNMAFKRHHIFSPQCRLYKDDTVLKVHVSIENKRHESMEYMYLAHINFHPIDGAELIYSADYKKNKVHKFLGDNMTEEDAKALMDYMNAVEKDSSLHHKVGAAGQKYDPEVCFTVYYNGDEDNRAYTMQYTDEGACYVSHPTDYLPIGIRWIARTCDEDSMGMVLPATSEHLGYSNAKRAGQVKVLEPMGKIEFMIEAGYIDKKKADEVKEKIEKINA